MTIAKLIVRETKITLRVGGSFSGSPNAHTHVEADVTDLTHVTSPDVHIADTANPHGTDIGNLGVGTLAELNAAISDAILGDDGPMMFVLTAGTVAVANALIEIFVPFNITITGWRAFSGTGSTGAGDTFELLASGTADDPLVFGTTVIADTAAVMGNGSQRGSTSTVASASVSAGSWLRYACTGVAATPGEDHKAAILWERA